MIEALSAASTIGGLVAFAVFCLIIPYCLSGNDSDRADVPAIGWLIVAMAAVIITFPAARDFPAITYLLAIPLYFVIGFLWFLGKWRALILRKLAEGREKVAKRGTSWPGMTDAEALATFRPEASLHKERITGWIVLWPWSMLWFVAKWPWRMAVKIAEWARGIADRMVDRLWAH